MNKSLLRSSKVVVIGGGLAIASKKKPVAPPLIRNVGLEFLWRLKSETIRRTLRLLRSILGLFICRKIINNIKYNLVVDNG